MDKNKRIISFHTNVIILLLAQIGSLEQIMWCNFLVQYIYERIAVQARCWCLTTYCVIYQPGQATAAAQVSGISHTSAGGSSARKFSNACHIQLAIQGTPFM